MTENEFRVKYSQLIQYYQYIEMRLKYICAELMADEEKTWFDNLDNLATDPFGLLIGKIKSLQAEKQIEVLSEDIINDLKKLKQTRNYWVHQSFGGNNPIIFRKGEVKNQGYADKLKKDLFDVIEWDEKLTELLRKHKTTV